MMRTIRKSVALVLIRLAVGCFPIVAGPECNRAARQLGIGRRAFRGGPI